MPLGRREGVSFYAVRQSRYVGPRAGAAAALQINGPQRAYKAAKGEFDEKTMVPMSIPCHIAPPVLNKW